jgi:hypothetical protein
MLQEIAHVDQVNSGIQGINVKRAAQTVLPVLILQALAHHVLDQLIKFLELLVFVQQTGFIKQLGSNVKLESFAQKALTMMVKITVCYVMHVLILALLQHPPKHACLHLHCRMVFVLVQVHSTKVVSIATI